MSELNEIPLRDYFVGWDQDLDGRGFISIKISGGRQYNIPIEIIRDALRHYEKTYES